MHREQRHSWAGRSGLCKIVNNTLQRASCRSCSSVVSVVSPVSELIFFKFYFIIQFNFTFKPWIPLFMQLSTWNILYIKNTKVISFSYLENPQDNIIDCLLYTVVGLEMKTTLYDKNL